MTVDEMSVDETSYCHRNICPNFFLSVVTNGLIETNRLMHLGLKKLKKKKKEK
jgi:hypothetical protein